MITKPSVSKVPIIVTTDQTLSVSNREVVSIVYKNTTAGAGAVTVSDGTANQGIELSAAQSGSVVWAPCQPAKFNKLVVVFTTGTGSVCIQTN